MRALQCNNNAPLIEHPKDKQVFPSLEFIGWYTVAQHPTVKHIALHEQVSSLQAASYAMLMLLLCAYSVLSLRDTAVHHCSYFYSRTFTLPQALR